MCPCFCDEVDAVAGGPIPLIVVIGVAAGIAAAATVGAAVVAGIGAYAHFSSDDCTTSTTEDANGNILTSSTVCT